MKNLVKKIVIVVLLACAALLTLFACKKDTQKSSVVSQDERNVYHYHQDSRPETLLIGDLSSHRVDTLVYIPKLKPRQNKN